jgi:hypothetical protein
MKVILGSLLLCAFVSAVMLMVVVDVVIKLLPFLLIAAVVIAIVHVQSRRGRRPRPGRPMSVGGPRARAVSPRPAYTNTAAKQGGWVFIPVWVPPTPRPARPYVDAEVIEGDRGV